MGERLSVQQQAQLARRGEGERRVTTPDNYYSAQLWRPGALNPGGGAASTATITAGSSAESFSYAKNGAMDVACVNVTGRIAKESDTNIVTPGQTIGGHSLEIHALECKVMPRTRSPRLVEQLFTEGVCKITYNGSEIALRVGPLVFIGGGGGLFGAMNDAAAIPPIAGGQVTEYFGNNGEPCRGNHMSIPEKLWWRPAGQPDSTLAIRVELARDIVTPVGQTEASGAGVRGFTQPTPTDLEIALMFKLHGVVFGERSEIL